jgi:hypothetical protein
MPEPTSPKGRRRWFSLSLRGLMILILVLGGLMGWKARRASLQRRAVARIEELKGSVVYDWQFIGNAFLIKAGASPPGPIWLRKLLGDEYFQEVAQVTLPGQFQPDPDLGTGDDYFERSAKANEAYRKQTVQPIEDDQLACLDNLDRLESMVFLTQFPLKTEGLARLEEHDRLKTLSFFRNLDAKGLGRLGRFTNLENLSVQFEESWNPDLAFLDKMPRLSALTLSGNHLTDDQLARVGRCPRLEFLSLIGDEVTDEGLAHLKSSVALKYLWILSGSNLTDRGLAHLERLTNLETLNLCGMPMSEPGLVHLRKLPKLSNVMFSQGNLDDMAINQFKAERPGIRLNITPTYPRRNRPRRRPQ